MDRRNCTLFVGSFCTEHPIHELWRYGTRPRRTVTVRFAPWRLGTVSGPEAAGIAARLRANRTCSDAPSHENGADGEPGADRRQEHPVAALHAAVYDGVVEGERDRGGGGVAE